MSHFTLRSGQTTTTVSLHCPQCRQRRRLNAQQWRLVQENAYALPRELYCSVECHEAHTRGLTVAVSQFYHIFAETWNTELKMLLKGVIPDEIAYELANMRHTRCLAQD